MIIQILQNDLEFNFGLTVNLFCVSTFISRHLNIQSIVLKIVYLGAFLLLIKIAIMHEPEVLL
jgi:hypothetical protein